MFLTIQNIGHSIYKEKGSKFLGQAIACANETEAKQIINGLRKSNNNININDQIENYWFFGGSTTWGYGVNDEYTYQGYYIDIGYVSSDSDGTGVFTDVGGEYDLFYDSTNEEENWIGFGDVSSTLSITNSGNIYTVEFNIYKC